jgi:hypothetical protein
MNCWMVTSLISRLLPRTNAPFSWVRLDRSISILSPTAPQAMNKAQTPLMNGDRPGDDYSQRHSWPTILEPYGWTKVGQRGDVILWKRPGKKDRGWSATSGYGADVLYIFSMNAAPFESEQSYTKFGAYTVLAHNGDWKAATKALAAQGSGAASNGHAPPSQRGGKHQPPSQSVPPPAPKEEARLTDPGNAIRLVRQYGKDLHYVHLWRKWLVWQDGRWKLDEVGAPMEKAKQVIAGLYEWAKDLIDELQADVWQGRMMWIIKPAWRGSRPC